MKNLKKVLVSVMMIQLIVSGMFFHNTASANEATEIFTGTEYMNGIVFGHGSVGDILFEGESSKKPTKQESVFIREFSSYMESNHQDALNNLKSSILSKDPYATMETLKDISANLNQYAKENNYKLPSSNEITPQACGLVAVCGAAVVLGLHQYVGVTYAVVGGAVVYLTVGTWGPGIKSNESPEKIILHVLDSL